jgi:hypothetical protein
MIQNQFGPIIAEDVDFILRKLGARLEVLGGRASCCATIIHFRTLLNSIRRRKLRILLLRGIMKSALGFRAERLLARLLVQTEYGGQFS